jgi:hypothetical protein
MATLSFLTGGYLQAINNLNGSGLGFFGAGGFGNSVAVGAYQDTTFITDGNGVSQGPQGNNVKYIHPSSGQVGGSTNVALTSLPNYQSTLNVRFNHSSSVRTQNARLYIYDRTSLNNAPTGVTCAVSHIIHPNPNQAAGGSGLSTWEFPTGSSYVNASVLANGNLFSPGLSGLSPNGGNTSDLNHDWYFAISASPNSVGSKTLFGLWFQTEYL